ncbi:Chitinase domain-containing protein 1 [Allomyces javanicus]|nr:Chitinase domain-containing protein 1 [Allomyces javanicus]
MIRSAAAFIVLVAIAVALWRQYDQRTAVSSTINRQGDVLHVPSVTFPARLTVLAYVTPWNTDGFSRTLEYHAKLDYVSPAWHSVRYDENKYHLVHSAERNQTWLDALARIPSDQRPQLMPRVVLDGLAMPELSALAYDPEGTHAANFASMLVDACRELHYDGVVLDVAAMLPHLNPVLEVVGKTLHAADFKLFISLSPIGTDAEPGDLIAALADYVDGFSLMTYDYSTARRRIGPNAPLPWVEEHVERLCPPPPAPCDHLLVGLNFYGMQADIDVVSGQPTKFDPVRGGDVARVLAATKSWTRSWDEDAAEEVIEAHGDAKSAALIWYPTARSMQMRLDVARRSGASIAIWEAGQGTDELWNAL